MTMMHTVFLGKWSRELTLAVGPAPADGSVCDLDAIELSDVTICATITGSKYYSILMIFENWFIKRDSFFV